MSKLDVRMDIERWFTGGGDFESGVELLDCMMNNPYYVSVIRRKGAKRGMDRYDMTTGMIKKFDRKYGQNLFNKGT